ncbi:uncharacterized protein EV422DRAFT_215297 [Fimicolochytrium jonesii]|uniref:uncharacterized protein n=1 Tax=Fimicolochytrium jonesii TaxID=1396493 RepID=UPI0022FDD3F6|nr:uncharacterized protein EV422DRAFT_215297 [Fimicolochytrium jonesii]KAI8817500.1 hypothetical protein EV422DRAFT_215297 [Fimicolochytrium jonesii]
MQDQPKSCRPTPSRNGTVPAAPPDPSGNRAACVARRMCGGGGVPPSASPQVNGETRTDVSVPMMNIVIQIVGSRRDVQPFSALTKELQTYGHRVRIATHETFRTWIRRYEVEFYPISGDPAVLMAFTVENKGLHPAKGDIGSKRKMIREILRGCWKSCGEADDETSEPFRAAVIIAKPAFVRAHPLPRKARHPAAHVVHGCRGVRTISFRAPTSSTASPSTSSSTG